MRASDHGTAALCDQQVSDQHVSRADQWADVGNAQTHDADGEPMDAARFDALSREVGTRTDRRGVLKTLVGGVLGIGGLAVASEAALGQKQCKNDSNCNGGRVCEKKRCVDRRKKTRTART